MTYDPNIPQNTPAPADIAAQIRQNFTTWGTVFATNHSPMNSRNEGKHEATYLQSQNVDPDITGDFVAVYDKVVTSNAGPFEALFARIPQFLPNGIPNNPQQLTYFTVNTAGPVYQSFLPGGYILYLGTVTMVSPIGTATVTLSPAPSEILCVMAQSNEMYTQSVPVPVDVAVVPTPGNPAEFQIISFLATQPGNPTNRFSWLAIGKQ